MGFHMLDLVVILLIGLAIFGPKALQSLARNAGKGISQANAMKDKVMAELPMEELSEVSRQIPRVPMNSHQAIHMLMRPEPEGKASESVGKAGENRPNTSKVGATDETDQSNH